MSTPQGMTRLLDTMDIADMYQGTKLHQFHVLSSAKKEKRMSKEVGREPAKKDGEERR